MNRLARVNELRLARTHLRAQVDAGVDLRTATVTEAEVALEQIDVELEALKEELQGQPEAAYLFARKRTRRSGLSQKCRPSRARDRDD